MGKFDNFSSFDVVHDVPLASYTSFKTGGKAAVFCVPKNKYELTCVLRDAADSNVPVYIMGRGTNLLVSDSGVDGLVVMLKAKLSGVEWNGEYVTSPAGVPLGLLARESVKRGYTGLEWAAGIPGTVGGAVAMNAGAYGGEMSKVLTDVSFYVAGMVVDTQVKEGDMGYRSSAFAAPRRVTVSARMKLERGDGGELERMNEFLKQRKAKQPLKYPSAGSTFKRPEGFFAGKLIEEAGLKGMRIGGAVVSEKHAGFIVNKGGATSTDIYRLSELVINKVFENSGVRLEREVKLWGDFSN